MTDDENAPFVYRHPETKQILFTDGFLEPFFLSSFLCLIKDGCVSTASKTSITINSESNMKKSLTILFEKGICYVEVDFDRPYDWTMQEDHACRGFAAQYGFTFEEWMDA